MGKRGPAQRPTALKLLHGERADRINHDEPVPREAMPEPPADASDEVAAVFRQATRELAAMNLAYACDAPSLLAYAEAVVMHRRVSRILAQPGEGDLLIPGALGGMVKNPMVAMQRDAAQTLLRFAQEFGLTPSARSSIKAIEAGPNGDANPFAAGS